MTARDITVVKCGGHACLEPSALCADVAEFAATGRTVVLVHGGSADIERLGARLGVPPQRLTSPDGLSARFTDLATLEVVSLALAGAVQPRLVTGLLAAGLPAVGLTGIGGALLLARRRRAQRAVVDGRTVIVRDDRSGHVTSVNTDLLGCLIGAGFVPVLSPPVLGDDGQVLNADADREQAITDVNAESVAAALRASTLLMLTSAPGVLDDPADPQSVMPVCPVPLAGPPPKRGGGMGVKLLAARDALAAGVPTVLIASGGGPAPVRQALSGMATRVTLATPVPAAAL